MDPERARNVWCLARSMARKARTQAARRAPRPGQLIPLSDQIPLLWIPDDGYGTRECTLRRLKSHRRSRWRVHSKFIVRGHWRNQAFGKKRLERKKRWIAAFWKGPKSGPSLARLYEVLKPDEKD